MILRTLLLTILLLALVACGESVPIDSGTVENPEGGTYLMQATQAAQRAISERKTATAQGLSRQATGTIQAATMVAGQTQEANIREATGTAQAIWSVQQEIANSATASALQIQQAEARQRATEASAAHQSEATGTAQANTDAWTQTAVIFSMNIAASPTANAQQATSTAHAATATRSALERQAALDRQQATATAQAIMLQETEAQSDAVRSAAWSDFWDGLIKVLIGIGGFGLVVMLIIQLARYLDGMALRQRLIETRAGTVMIVSMGRGQYVPQLVQSTTTMLGTGDEFDETQTSSVDAEAEPLKVTNWKGANWIARTDPEDELRETQRKLAMRLLRESMRYYSSIGIDPQQGRVATFRDLGWSSETRVRAVNSLKPHLSTKQGRGGGTLCSAQYPNVVALYTAVGERRVVPTLAPQHSPTLEALTA